MLFFLGWKLPASNPSSRPTATYGPWPSCMRSGPKRGRRPENSEKISFEKGCDISEEEQERFDALRIWRNERARDLGYEAYMVASNDALLSVAKCPVETADDLLKIKGFGPRKVELYGEEIVALLNSI